jgi:hypothetical protein
MPAAVFFAALALLSIVQVAADFIDESKVKAGSVEIIKKPEYCIFIEIEDKILYLLQDDKCIREYPIASGKSGLPSPLGFWKIIEKGDWGEGFGGRWLGLNVPWGTYGIHGTIFGESIGSPASHGCIRMFNNDIKELYNMVPLGTPVVIVNGPYGPFGRGFDEINPGDRGADVLAIQHRLKDLGFFNGSLSGIYDEDTKKAVHKFQKASRLQMNNTIDRKCWEAMGFREFE